MQYNLSHYTQSILSYMISSQRSGVQVLVSAFSATVAPIFSFKA